MTTPLADPTATPPDPTPSGGTPPASAARPGPAEALADLLAGNRRFVSRSPRYGHDVAAAAAASGGQAPSAVVLGCIDSRVPLEAIFDQTFGAICVARSGAHVLDQAMVGSVEFAVGTLGVRLIMVLGHERCGAVEATVEAVRRGAGGSGDRGLHYLVREIAPAVVEAGVEDPDVCGRAIRRHVARTVQRLSSYPPVAEAVGRAAVAVVGGVYDLDTGRVEMLD